MYIKGGKEDPNRKGAHAVAIDKAANLTPSAKKTVGKEGESNKVIIRKK